MRSSYLYLIGVTAAALLVSACGAQMSQMHQHVVQEEWAQALELAKAGEAEERGLAVLILEQAAGAEDPQRPVRSIAATGRTGHPSLERLRESDRPEVRQLVAIYLNKDIPDDDALKAYTHSDFTSVREAAFAMWADQMKTTALEKAALDPAAYVRQSAIRELASRELNADQTALLKEAALRDPDFGVRTAAATSGSKLGEDALEILQQLLDSKQLGLRIAAVKGLAKLGTDPAIALLRKLTDQQTDEVALAAAAELARAGKTEALAVFETAVRDTRPSLRVQALLRLERAKHPDREELIVAALDDRASEVAIIAAELAVSFADETQKKKIIEVATKIFEADGAGAPRARNLLASLGDKNALAAIEEILKSDDPAEVSTLLPQVSLVRPLKDTFVTLMSHPNADVRLAAAYAVLATKR